jgi:hypothetical protein
VPESPLPERTRNRDPLPREAVLLPRVAGPARRDDVSFGGPPTADERDDMVHGERLWRELAAAIVASPLRSLALPPLAAPKLPGSCTLSSNLLVVGDRREGFGWICHIDEAIGDSCRGEAP